LELGIGGKLALWRALGAAAPRNSRLQGIDFEHLAARAELQQYQVEARRLEAAQAAFGSCDPDRGKHLMSPWQSASTLVLMALAGAVFLVSPSRTKKAREK